MGSFESFRSALSGTGADMGGEPEPDGEWVQCPHCDATGKQQGPGGWEPCCHCNGRGERWFDDREDADLDMREKP